MVIADHVGMLATADKYWMGIAYAVLALIMNNSSNRARTGGVVGSPRKLRVATREPLLTAMSC